MKFARIGIVFVLMLSILQAFRARANSRCLRMIPIYAIDPDILKVIEYLGPSIPTIAVVTFISSTLKESLEKQIASNKETLEKEIAH